MFTGLVEETGTLVAVRRSAGARHLRVRCQRVLEDAALGDSIAVNGVCQTVVARGADWLAFDAVGDTLSKTTVEAWVPGEVLNLERACRADARLGGHIVQGHVQAVGRVVRWEPRGIGWSLEVEVPEALRATLVPEGSVAIDGMSLTVAEVRPRSVRLSIVPHTRKATNLALRRVGDRVNLEGDVLTRPPAPQTVTEARLRDWGY